MEVKRINLDINEELWRQVSIRSAETGINKKEIVEIALKQYLSKGDKHDSL